MPLRYLPEEGFLASHLLAKLMKLNFLTDFIDKLFRQRIFSSADLYLVGRKTVERLEFFRQIADVVIGIEFTAGIFEKDGGLIAACVAVDMLAEPCLDVAEIRVFQSLAQVAEIVLHAHEHLCAVCASERIGGEISEASARPVRILQTAPGVVGNVNAEIFLVKAVPFGGKIGDGKRAGDQLLFDPVANNEGRTVGKLVSSVRMSEGSALLTAR